MPTTLRVLALSALLAFLAPRLCRAEDSVSYEYEDYRESGDRIAVRTQGAYAEQDFGTDTHVKLFGVLDAIAGATPTGQPAPAGSDQVPLTGMHERRKAWNADVLRQLGRVGVDFGFGNSRESDYISNGWSLNTATDFNEKNTELLAGVAGTDDKIKVYYGNNVPRQRKHTNDLLLGVTQLLDPLTSLRFNISWGRQSGYLSDPYKVVQKRVEEFPGIFLAKTFSENRPDYREKWVALAGMNRAFPRLHAALDATYRYYRDTYGTRSHTADVAWLQHLGEPLILEPSFRFYRQSAADFYHYDLDATSIVPYGGAPHPEGPFYSSDHRLSTLRTLRYGIELVWNATRSLELQVLFQRYEMRGLDGVTPQSAYPRARIVAAGGKFSW